MSLRMVFAAMLIAVSANAYSCPALVGTWKSSKELSLEQTSRYGKLTTKQWNVYRQLVGIMTVTITENEIHLHGLPPIKIEVDGEAHEFALEERFYTYKTESCSDKVVHMIEKDSDNNTDRYQINFVDKDTFWIRFDILRGAREYYVKVKN